MKIKNVLKHGFVSTHETWFCEYQGLIVIYHICVSESLIVTYQILEGCVGFLEDLPRRMHRSC